MKYCGLFINNVAKNGRIYEEGKTSKSKLFIKYKNFVNLKKLFLTSSRIQQGWDAA